MHHLIPTVIKWTHPMHWLNRALHPCSYLWHLTYWCRHQWLDLIPLLDISEIRFRNRIHWPLHYSRLLGVWQKYREVIKFSVDLRRCFWVDLSVLWRIFRSTEIKLPNSSVKISRFFFIFVSQRAWLHLNDTFFLAFIFSIFCHRHWRIHRYILVDIPSNVIIWRSENIAPSVSKSSRTCLSRSYISVIFKLAQILLEGRRELIFHYFRSSKRRWACFQHSFFTHSCSISLRILTSQLLQVRYI